MIDYSNFPEYYMSYAWSGKHTLFGYPPDSFPEFNWIASLEKRFQWVARNYAANNSASKYLLQEMIEWGGSQNGVLQKFNDASGEVNLFEALADGQGQWGQTCLLTFQGMIDIFHAWRAETEWRV